MQMGHGFAGIGSVVEDEPEAALCQAKLPGDFGGFQHEMTEQGVIFRFGFGDAGDGPFGDDQHVLGGLRLDILKGDDLVVFVNDRSRDFAGDDLFKQGFAHDIFPFGGQGLFLRRTGAAPARRSHLQPSPPAERNFSGKLPR